MTPREKASELIVNYQTIVTCLNYKEAKQCALVMVDEILDALDKSLIDADIEWWKEVKQEIEKL